MTRIEDLLDVATRSAVATAAAQPTADSLPLDADEYDAFAGERPRERQ